MNQTTADDSIRHTETTGVPVPQKVKLPGHRFQHWYWADAWHRGERQADEDIRAGRVESFDSMDDFLETLP
jgi:hypothetical protein